MDLLSVVSFLAVLFTSVAAIPQIFKVWKTRSARDISYGWIGIYSTGCVLWLTFGYLTKNKVIMTADSIVLTVQMILLSSKIYFDSKG